MNYFLPFWSSPVYRVQTDRQTDALCNLQRWAQRNTLTDCFGIFFIHIFLLSCPLLGLLQTWHDLLLSPYLLYFEEWKNSPLLPVSPVSLQQTCKSCIRVFLVLFRGISGKIFRGCSVLDFPYSFLWSFYVFYYLLCHLGSFAGILMEYQRGGGISGAILTEYHSAIFH